MRSCSANWNPVSIKDIILSPTAFIFIPDSLAPPQPPLRLQCNIAIYIYSCCPASRTTLVATRFRVAVICPIIQVPHCIRVFFYFVWFVFINHIFQFYYELCTYCNILDIYLS